MQVHNECAFSHLYVHSFLVPTGWREGHSEVPKWSEMPVNLKLEIWISILHGIFLCFLHDVLLIKPKDLVLSLFTTAVNCPSHFYLSDKIILGFFGLIFPDSNVCEVYLKGAKRMYLNFFLDGGTSPLFRILIYVIQKK